MTGTSYDANPADVWSILNWLEPQFFTSYWRFYNSHVNYKEIEVRRGQWVKVINKAQPVKDPENFARLLRQFSLKRTKKEVRPDLPERIDQYVDLQMNSDQADYYSKIIDAEDMLISLDDNELNDQFITIQLTRILKLIQVTTDPTLLGVKSSSVKLDWVMDWLEDNPNETVIVFTRFRDSAIKIHSTLMPNASLIIGGNTNKHISKAELASKPQIVGTIAAMGEGLDLPHIDNAIFIDVEWSSILMQQAIDRIHRINIDNVKHLYFLRCQNTVDELVHQAVRDKWSTKELVENFLKGVCNANWT
jgi:SNF2 family DNA or RNA helicase